jgi:hypothetical protein
MEGLERILSILLKASILQLMRLDAAKSQWIAPLSVAASASGVGPLVGTEMPSGVTSLGSFSNLERASATTLCSPLMYLISGPYSSAIILQHRTCSVLICLKVRFLWSVYTIILWPRRMFLYSFRVSTILNNSLSVVVYLVWALLRVQEKKAKGLPSCEMTAPSCV